MPETKHPLKVFLCHASVDKPKVRELYRYLRRRGVNPWFDEEHLVGGQDWQVEIPKALATSDAIIICLTKNSVDKEGYIQKEIKFALDKALEMPEGRIFLIPVKFEECEVPFSLSRYQWVDLTVESGYSKMMKALKFRASQLERATVELSKKSVEEDKLTREKAVREKIEREATEKTQLEAEELAKQKAAKEKSERETAEKATREKAEREAAEKVTQEKNKKEVEREFEKSIKKAKRDLRWKKFKTNIRYRLQLIWIYRVPILILLVTFGLIVPLLIRLSNLIPKITSEFNNTPTATIGLSLVPQQNLTSTEAFIPTEIFTPSSIPTENFTPAPLLTEIADDEDVPMVLVSEGEFIAGSVGVERKVYLDTFYIDKYEVTNFQYSKCVLNGKCRTPADSKLGDYDYYGNPQYDNFPVVWVNSEMAQDYCEWREARLPSVLEWEKAARGTDGRLYPWGNDLDNVKRANSYSSTDGYQITSPVGSFPEGVSPYGVYDMAGNVAEWTSDQISIGSTWRYGDEFMFDSQDYLASGGSDPDEGFRCARDSYP